MSVLRRDLRAHLRTSCDVFDKVLVFHNKKHGTVLVAFGLSPNGDVLCGKADFEDTHLLSTNVADIEINTFWALLAFDDVVEIDPSEWKGLQDSLEVRA